jgi:hypothetical protein
VVCVRLFVFVYFLCVTGLTDNEVWTIEFLCKSYLWLFTFCRCDANAQTLFLANLPNHMNEIGLKCIYSTGATVANICDESGVSGCKLDHKKHISCI